MEYSQFADLCEKVRNKEMCCDEAAATLNKRVATKPQRTGDATQFDASLGKATIRSFSGEEPYLADHRVDGAQVLIGVTYASLGIDHFFAANPEHRFVRMQNLNFLQPVRVDRDTWVRISIDSTRSESTTLFEVTAETIMGETSLVASGRMSEASILLETIDIAGLKNGLIELGDLDSIYATNSAVELGATYKTVTELYVGDRQLLARAVLSPAASQDSRRYVLHPLLINSAFLALHPLTFRHDCDDVYLPFAIRDIHCSRTTDLQQCWLIVSLAKKTDELMLFDFKVLDDDGLVVASFEGCALKRRRDSVSAIPNEAQTVVELHSEVKETAVADSTDVLYDKIQTYVIQKIKQVSRIGASEFGLRRNIMDMGMASAQLVAVGAAMQEDAGIELYPTLFFEYTNVKELTDYFYNEHRHAFAKLLVPTAVPISAPIAAPMTASTSPPVAAFGAKVGGTDALALPRQTVSSKPSSADPISNAERKSNSGPSRREEIAVIGMHGQFAQADNLDQFWGNLCAAREVMGEIPEDHWDYRPWFDENRDAPNKTYCKWGSFIDGVDKFDATFFNISRREAEWMDPQVRLFLQSIYSTADDAGYAAKVRGTNTGVFVGSCFHDYDDKIKELNLPVSPIAGVNNSQTAVANRISFYLDLTGPSIAVDTACSSSLVALHYACQALRSKECDLAFVGGVNLLLSSFHYRVFSCLKALSPTGRCHTFDESADGYVPGECIASILLKPLSQAIRDGDHIEAIIKGSAALHGGYTPSLTAPSVAGEQNVIVKAWQDAAIDPETITYVEAHGTGTKLGDPVEINSLKSAFARFTKKQHFCSVGSAKANIGHAEGAAGIAGVLKVILQMKHRMIPPLMGFKSLNPYISIEKSALCIHKESVVWDSPPGVPRRSGVSSFGVAGAYAHVVIEEYLRETPTERLGTASQQAPVIIVLSARNEQRLADQAQQLLGFVRQGKLTDFDLPDAAYTLQVGRQVMEARLAMQIASVGALEEKLAQFLQGREGVDMYHGHIKPADDLLAALSTDEEFQNVAATLLRKGKYEKLMNLWVKGFPVNWGELYAVKRHRLISLPTYPFARERYWLPDSDIERASVRATAGSVVGFHPLLQENISDLYAQRYRTRLSGDEFFLADHQVRGSKVLPGVAYLEMARAAIAQAVGRPLAHDGVHLKNVVWIRPIVVGLDAQHIYIEINPAAEDEITFEIYSLPTNGVAERVTFSRGHARIGSAAPPAVRDLASLQAECRGRILTQSECYHIIANMGLKLGHRLRGIEAVHLGEDRLLAKLNLPATLAMTREQYVLHPSLMDSSLQAAAFLILGEGNAVGKLALPYALEGLEVFGPCSAQMWVFGRFSGDVSGDARVSKIDIDLCDDYGTVCVRMRGLSFRSFPVMQDELEVADVSASLAIGTDAAAASRVLLAEPVWRDSVRRKVPQREDWVASKILICELDDATSGSIVDAHGAERCVVIANSDSELPERFQQIVVRALSEIQELFRLSAQGRVLLQIVVASDPQRRAFRGLSALLKSARLENSRFCGQLIEADSANSQLLSSWIAADGEAEEAEIRYLYDQRLVLEWREIASDGIATVPWKDGGIYLITGGAGEMGTIFAQEILKRVAAPILILTGRSSLNDAQQARVARLQSLGGSVDYRRADVADRQSVSDLIAAIVAEHGRLDGVIHGAGVLRDGLLQHMSVDDLAAVMAPKIHGVVNLDDATQDLPLDFFVLFSSIAGALGNAGQSAYAASNAFMDGYAAYRQSLVDLRQRHGKSLSVNWPIWKDGGMQPNAPTLKLLRQTVGIIPMESRSGLDAFYLGMSAASQVMVLAGELERLRMKVLAPLRSSSADLPAMALPIVAAAAEWNDPATLVSVAEDGGDATRLREKTLEMLVQKTARLLKIDVDEVDVRSDLDKFGLDSIALTEFTGILNQEYGFELTPTVFYEHFSLLKFGEYLLERHRPAVAAKLLPHTRLASASKQRHATPEMPPAADSVRRHFRSTLANSKQPDYAVKERDTEESADEIAIVGMSGCFPKARNVSELWRNLIEGRDCISEIPADRWDWQAIYGDPQQGNKSNVKWGGFVDNVAEFDPLFFGISPREAVLMDPQQRLLMTYAWLAIEDAGISAQSLSGTDTAIFVGTSGTGYSELLSHANIPIDALSATGMVASVGPNRMSYFLNLHGPSHPIETACSSSLIAIHRGVQAIVADHCEMALVGGVNTIINPDLHVSFSKAGMLSEDGRCKTFSVQANGFARGEGVGMVLLKKLRAAEQDGDQIYGVIRATVENHGGRAKSLTAPSPKAQSDLLKLAYLQAGIDPATVGYVETHGTGTALGDPIEIEGLKSAFRALSTSSQGDGAHTGYCGLGSVKSNIGHLELAAGIVGVIKVLLQLKHKTLVKTLHCDTINPYIQLKDSPFFIVRENQDWMPIQDVNGMDLPRRAGVSSFGFGGANCHIVIDEYIDKRALPSAPLVTDENPTVVLLSARTADRLNEHARQLLTFLQESSPTDGQLAEIAYTLQTGRDAMEVRLAITTTSISDLCEKLRQFIAGTETQEVYHGESKRGSDVLSLFSGDAQLKDAVGNWLECRKFSKLLRLWVQGFEIDWSRLYGTSKLRRVNLPTYPFAKERYWAPRTRSNVAQIESSRESRAQRLVKCFMEKTWRLSDEPPVARPAVADRRVVILTTRETQSLAEALGRHFANGRIVYLSDLEVQYEKIKEEWDAYDGCIDIIGCGTTLHYSMNRVKLLQRIIEEGPRDDIMLMCVTKGLEAHENRSINMSGAQRAGLYRMLQSEYRHIRSRHLDVEPEQTDESLALQITSEYHMASRSTEVCYRGGKRFIACLTENGQWAEPRARLSFSPERVLWISGGTRGLGYLCAQHFVTNYGVTRLVLSGREEVPPRDQWAAYRDQNSPLANKIRSYLALESQGVQLLVLSVSFTDSAAVQASVALIRSTLGDIGGVIHCAGSISLENPAFVHKSQEEFQQVLDPKVAGLDAFFEHVKGEPLHFFALFSSVSAVIPSLAPGLSDYAMANAYMDYFARAHYPMHPVVSIQWPRWKESGMGGGLSKAYDRTGLLSHTDLEGLELLDSILSHRVGAVVLPATVNPKLWNPSKLMQATLDPETSASAYSTVVSLSKSPRNNVSQTANTINSSEFSRTEESLTTLAERWLTRFFADELRIAAEELRPDTPFHEYGMESVMLAQVVGRMERELQGITIDPTVILENSTIRQLAVFLANAFPKTFAALQSVNGTKPPASDRLERIAILESDANNTPEVKKREELEVQLITQETVNPTTVSRCRRIAVIGMSCHFPDAPDLAEFWQNLITAKDSIVEVPKSRWNSDIYFSADKVRSGKSVSKWGAFLENIEDFDANYFKVSESLAVQMDPLERQWLEVSAETLADAGYDRGQLWGRKIGVFVGARTANYKAKLTTIDKDVIVGLGQNFIAAHLSHIYNFKGPNLVVDAACASSLTAIHLAVRSLNNGESEMALAGGVEILLDESPFVVLSTAQVLSPDGRCKTFDESANGIGLGEGCGVLLLKPLADAILAGDKIYGVIDGSAINNDGNTMGITTPNPDAQRELVETAIADADIDPATVTYVETHGTGTLIGDPIELNGLTKIFSAGAVRQQACGVGSVKSNIGHLLSAAGAAGIIKVLLSISHRLLPPTIHCEKPNRRFNFKNSPLYLVKEVTDWRGIGQVLRAGVSSFGLGGNNAHVILSDEGIPPHLRAAIVPKGDKVVFNKRRHWPEPLRKPEIKTPDTKPTREPETAQFLEFFDARILAADAPVGVSERLTA